MEGEDKKSKKEVKLKSFIPQLLFFYKNINIIFFFFHAQQHYNINLF